MDVTVKLLDVFPDGRAMNMVEGITRTRDRNTYGTLEMVKPGTVYTVPVDLHATSWYLPPGHRLRVEVSSSNFPRFDRNLNTTRACVAAGAAGRFALIEAWRP